MKASVYIKGFFKPTSAAEAALEALGIINPAGREKRLEGLWDSVTVPSGIFVHTPGCPALPGRLALKD